MGVILLGKMCRIRISDWFQIWRTFLPGKNRNKHFFWKKVFFFKFSYFQVSLSVRTVFVGCLAGSDLLMCLFSLPITAISIFSRVWVFPAIFCKLIGVFQVRNWQNIDFFALQDPGIRLRHMKTGFRKIIFWPMGSASTKWKVAPKVVMIGRKICGMTSWILILRMDGEKIELELILARKIRQEGHRGTKKQGKLRI